jgi:hypothetical protein
MPHYTNIPIDSSEELYIIWYLETLRNWNYIESYNRAQSYSLSDEVWRDYDKQLKTKVKVVPEQIIKGHEYTPDLQVIWKPQALGVFTEELDGRARRNLPFVSQDLVSIIEVKPSHDFHNMTRAAMINIKWVWEKYGILVNIIKHEQLFSKTFTPERYLLTNKSMKPRTIKYKNVRNIKQFIESVHQ